MGLSFALAKIINCHLITGLHHQCQHDFVRRNIHLQNYSLFSVTEPR